MRKILLAVISLTSLTVSVAYADEEQKIREAADTCLKPNEPYCPKVDNLIVRVIKVHGNYALASVERADGEGETEMVYLEKSKNGGWYVLNRGTMIDTSELGIPEDALRDLNH